MPRDYLFPSVTGVSGLVTLSEDTVFTPAMLGCVVELAGFDLELVEIAGHGSFNFTGPGSYSGLLEGELAEGQGLVVNVHGADFTMTGSQAVAVTIGSVTGLTAALAGKSAVSHTHAQADVTGLVTALSGKAATSHAHAESDITGLVTHLSGKAAVSHTHAITDVTGLADALDSVQPSYQILSEIPQNTRPATKAKRALDFLEVTVETDGVIIITLTTFTGSTNFPVAVVEGDSDAILAAKCYTAWLGDSEAVVNATPGTFATQFTLEAIATGYDRYFGMWVSSDSTAVLSGAPRGLALAVGCELQAGTPGGLTEQAVVSQGAGDAVTWECVKSASGVYAWRPLTGGYIWNETELRWERQFIGDGAFKSETLS